MSNYRANNYSQVAAENQFNQQQHYYNQQPPHRRPNQPMSSQMQSQSSQQASQQQVPQHSSGSYSHNASQQSRNYGSHVGNMNPNNRTTISLHPHSHNVPYAHNNNTNNSNMNYRNNNNNNNVNKNMNTPNLAQVVASPNLSQPSQQQQQQKPVVTSSSTSNVNNNLSPQQVSNVSNLPSNSSSSQQQQQQQPSSQSQSSSSTSTQLSNITSSSQQQQQPSSSSQVVPPQASSSSSSSQVIPPQSSSTISSSSQQQQQQQSSPHQHPLMKNKPIVQNQSDKLIFYGTKYEVKCDETFAFYEGHIIDYDAHKKLFHVLYGWKNAQDVPLNYIRPVAPKTNYDTWKPKVGDRVECKAKAEEREPFGWWDARIRLVNEHAFQYMIQFEGWNDDHDEILRLEMLRPYNPHPVLSEVSPFSYHDIVRGEIDISNDSKDIQNMIKSISTYEVPPPPIHSKDQNQQQQQQQQSKNNVPMDWLKSKELQLWANRANFEINFIKNHTKVIHIGYRPDIQKFIIIGIASQVEDAKILLKHAIIIQSKFNSVEKKLKSDEEYQQTQFNTLSKCVKLKVPFLPKFFQYDDTDPKYDRLNSFMRNNIRLARGIEGVQLIRTDTKKHEFFILATDQERAQEAKELIDMDIQSIKVSRKVLRDLIGQQGENIKKLEETSLVNKICTVKNYATLCNDHDYDVDEQDATEITMIIVGPKLNIPMAISLLQNDVEVLEAKYNLRQREYKATKELKKNGFGEYEDWDGNQNNKNKNNQYNSNNNNNNYNEQAPEDVEYNENDISQQPDNSNNYYDENGVLVDENNIDYNETTQVEQGQEPQPSSSSQGGNYNSNRQGQRYNQSQQGQRYGNSGGSGGNYQGGNYYNRNNYNNNRGGNYRRGGGGGRDNRYNNYNNNGYNNQNNNEEFDEQPPNSNGPQGGQGQHVSQRRQRRQHQQEEFYDDENAINGNYDNTEEQVEHHHDQNDNNNNENNNTDDVQQEHNPEEEVSIPHPNPSPPKYNNRGGGINSNEYRGSGGGGGGGRSNRGRGGNVDGGNYRSRNYNNIDNTEDSSSPSNAKWQKKDTKQQSESIDNEQQS